MTRTDAHSGFGTLFSTVASLASPARVRSGGPEAMPQRVIRPKGRHWLTRGVDLLFTWSERTRERRQLMQFDDHVLRDIGITRADAAAEAAKPFWRS